MLLDLEKDELKMAKKNVAFALLTFTTSVEGYAAEVGNLTTTSVPEPATVFLFGASLLSFVGVDKRKKS